MSNCDPPLGLKPRCVHPAGILWVSSESTRLHAPTHPLRTIIANSDVECVLRAKTQFWSRVTPVTPVTPRHFAWQAWHLATSTFVSRGRHGTWRHLPSFCLAGMTLMALDGALGSVLVAGDAGDAAALCVVGVALGDIHLCFTWQARNSATSTFVCVAGVTLMALGGALGSVLVAGDAGDAAALCMAGVALGDIHLRFTWPARHLATSTFVFPWQAWHLWHWVACLGRFWSRVTPTPVTPRHFAWQAWHTWSFFRHTHTHTLAQKHLIELLMWNASHVHKQPSKTDRHVWKIRSEKT